MKIGGVKQFIKHFESLPAEVNGQSYRARIYFNTSKEDYYPISRNYYEKAMFYENGAVELYQKDGDYVLFDVTSVYKIEITRPGG